MRSFTLGLSLIGCLWLGGSLLIAQDALRESIDETIRALDQAQRTLSTDAEAGLRELDPVLALLQNSPNADPEVLVRALTLHAEGLSLNGRYREARLAAQPSVALARTLIDRPALLATALQQLAAALTGLGELQGAIEARQQAADLLVSMQSPLRFGELGRLGSLLVFNNRFDEGMAQLQAAMDAPELSEADQAVIHAALCVAASGLVLDSAIRHCRAVRDIYMNLDLSIAKNRANLARARSNFAHELVLAGHLEDALAEIDAATLLAAPKSSTAGYLVLHRAAAMLDSGRPAAAEALLIAEMERHLQDGDSILTEQIYRALAELYGKTGDDVRAADFGKRALQRAIDTGDAHPVMHLSTVGRALLKLGQPREALDFLVRVQDVPSDHPQQIMVADVYGLRGRALMELGEDAAAARQLALALEIREQSASDRSRQVAQLLAVEFGTEQKQRQLHQARRAAERNAVVAIGVVLLSALCLMLAALAVHRRRQRDLLAVKSALERAVSERTCELQDANARISHLLSYKDGFLAQVSHEFRTPISIMLNSLEALASQFEATRLDQEFKRAQRSAKRLLLMVNQLLEVARLRAARDPQLQLVELRSALRLLIDSAAGLAEDRGLLLHIRVDEPAVVALSPDALDVMVGNVIGNALQHVQPGGEIHLSLRRQSALAVIVIADDGPGIATELMADLGQRFHGSQSLAPGRGMGVGLALVSEMAAVCGGSVDIESATNCGTVVTISLPLADVDGIAQPESRSPAQDVRESLSTLTTEVQLANEVGDDPVAPDLALADRALIVLVEDNPDLREQLSAALASDYEVHLAVDGLAAEVLIRDLLPDLVISDVMMPGLDGFELCRRLKESESTAHVPVILLTARAGEEAALLGLSMRADEFLEKPVSIKELKLRVANILATRKALAERLLRQVEESPATPIGGVLPGSIVLNVDPRFAERLNRILSENYANSRFNSSELAAALNLSARQLRRKMAAVYAQGPNEFLRHYRLRQAAQTLRSGERVKKAAHAAGFESVAHFCRSFTQVYGLTPSEYAGRECADSVPAAGEPPTRSIKHVNTLDSA